MVGSASTGDTAGAKSALPLAIVGRLRPTAPVVSVGAVSVAELAIVGRLTRCATVGAKSAAVDAIVGGWIVTPVETVGGKSVAVLET